MRNRGMFERLCVNRTEVNGTNSDHQSCRVRRVRSFDFITFFFVWLVGSRQLTSSDCILHIPSFPLPLSPIHENGTTNRMVKGTNTQFHCVTLIIIIIIIISYVWYDIIVSSIDTFPFNL